MCLILCYSSYNFVRQLLHYFCSIFDVPADTLANESTYGYVCHSVCGARNSATERTYRAPCSVVLEISVNYACFRLGVARSQTLREHNQQAQQNRKTPTHTKQTKSQRQTSIPEAPCNCFKSKRLPFPAISRGFLLLQARVERVM